MCYNFNMISYKPFFETLEKSKTSQYKLINHYLISANTLYRMKRNKPVSLVTIEYLCNILKCNVEDVVVIV